MPRSLTPKVRGFISTAPAVRALLVRDLERDVGARTEPGDHEPLFARPLRQEVHRCLDVLLRLLRVALVLRRPWTAGLSPMPERSSRRT